MKYHVLPCGSVVSVEEQALNERFDGITLVDADGTRRYMASVVLRGSGSPVRKDKPKVIRVKGKAPRQ